MTIRETIQKIEGAISVLYDSREATAVARQVVCRRCGYNFSQLVVHYDDETQIPDLESIVAELAAARPVQYVLGVAEFCDLDFTVSEGVLIPRPETEELVEWVASGAKRGARILDVGTGSGAIAVALAKKVEGAEIVAVDISEKALQIAAENVARHSANVTLVKADALGDMSHLGQFDIIVSNPPYIPQSDIAAMHSNVVDYEPHTALFVEDDDPLCFYRSIAQNGVKMLRDGGSLYFEIYERFGAQMVKMLEEMGYSDSEVVKDVFGKERMVWSRR
ncbi:MAG: peptide chain release factor N(5)-glutamine methyltransferase [Rikenellaceae bacterium]|nr:peptide chain release factor N(5)-glutamine methyltransferase [Rikenellaceae bacterium]